MYFPVISCFSQCFSFILTANRYCKDNVSKLEHLLHCDGIWLHALRYAGPSIAAPPVPWWKAQEQEQEQQAKLAQEEQVQAEARVQVVYSTGESSSDVVVDTGASATSGKPADLSSGVLEPTTGKVLGADKNGNSSSDGPWSFQSPYPSWAAPFGYC
jgi:ketosteroid isomerase-like protein